jgi:hypothetical protein
MAALPQETSMSHEEPAELRLVVSKPSPVSLRPALILSERRKISFIAKETERIVAGLEAVGNTSNEQIRLKTRATILGGILGRLSMISVPKPGTPDEVGLIATVKAAETEEVDQSFLGLYNAYGDHPAVRPIDTAFDQLEGAAKADAKIMMRGAMILISKVSDQ